MTLTYPQLANEQGEQHYPVVKRWTVDEYIRLAMAGAFELTPHIELVNGYIFDMPPMGSGHSGHHHTSRKYLSSRYDEKYVIFGHCTVMLDAETALDPDIVVCKFRADSYAHQDHLLAEDCLLIIEVANSSFEYDVGNKADFYARAGIGEYWVIDVKRRELVHFQEPAPLGYRAKQTYPADKTFTSELLGEVIVNELFPPPVESGEKGDGA